MARVRRIRRRYIGPKKKVMHYEVQIERVDDAAGTQVDVTLFTPDLREHWTVVRTIVDQLQWRVKPHATDDTDVMGTFAIWIADSEEKDEGVILDLTEIGGSWAASGSNVVDAEERYLWNTRHYSMLPGADTVAEGLIPITYGADVLRGQRWDSKTMRKVPEDGRVYFSWYWGDSAAKATGNDLLVTIHLFLKRMD